MVEETKMYLIPEDHLIVIEELLKKMVIDNGGIITKTGDVHPDIFTLARWINLVKTANT